MRVVLGAPARNLWLPVYPHDAVHYGVDFQSGHFEQQKLTGHRHLFWRRLPAMNTYRTDYGTCRILRAFRLFSRCHKPRKAVLLNILACSQCPEHKNLSELRKKTVTRHQVPHNNSESRVPPKKWIQFQSGLTLQRRELLCSLQTLAPSHPTTHQSRGPALWAGERLLYEVPHSVAQPAGVPLQPEKRREPALRCPSANQPKAYRK